MNAIKPADPIMLAGMTDCLAIAVENAVVEWGDTLDVFFDKFVKSGLADSFSNQEPFVTTGCAGEELVAMLNEKISQKPQTTKIAAKAGFTEYYWIGYALALFVGEYGLSVSQVIAVIPPSEWLRMYSLYHEYGEGLLLEKLNIVYESKKTENRHYFLYE